MSHELHYTSVARGLRVGSTGYCTVAATAHLPGPIAERMEGLSSYRAIYPPNDPSAAANPTVISHFRLALAGQSLNVLSRVGDAGLDYSGRGNKYAHHVAIEATERPDGGPAWLAARPGFLDATWSGEPRVLPIGRVVPSGDRPARACEAWAHRFGDAGWAGVLAEAFLTTPDRPAYLVYEPGEEILPLFVEALALLPRSRRWDVTFSTYFTGQPQGLTCLWRGVIRDSPEALQAARLADALILDPKRPPGIAAGGELVNRARTGTAAPAPRPSSAASNQPEATTTPGRILSSEAGRTSMAPHPAARRVGPQLARDSTPVPPSRSGRLTVIVAVGLAAGLVLTAGVAVALRGRREAQVRVIVARVDDMAARSDYNRAEPFLDQLARERPELVAEPAVEAAKARLLAARRQAAAAAESERRDQFQVALTQVMREPIEPPAGDPSRRSRLDALAIARSLAQTGPEREAVEVLSRSRREQLAAIQALRGRSDQDRGNTPRATTDGAADGPVGVAIVSRLGTSSEAAEKRPETDGKQPTSLAQPGGAVPAAAKPPAPTVNQAAEVVANPEPTAKPAASAPVITKELRTFALPGAKLSKSLADANEIIQEVGSEGDKIVQISVRNPDSIVSPASGKITMNPRDHGMEVNFQAKDASTEPVPLGEFMWESRKLIFKRTDDVMSETTRSAYQAFRGCVLDVSFARAPEDPIPHLLHETWQLKPPATAVDWFGKNGPAPHPWNLVKPAGTVFDDPLPSFISCNLALSEAGKKPVIYTSKILESGKMATIRVQDNAAKPLVMSLAIEPSALLGGPNGAVSIKMDEWPAEEWSRVIKRFEHERTRVKPIPSKNVDNLLFYLKTKRDDLSKAAPFPVMDASKDKPMLPADPAGATSQAAPAAADDWAVALERVEALVQFLNAFHLDIELSVQIRGTVYRIVSPVGR